MLLAADVGNTDIVLGAFDGPNLHQIWRVDSTTRRTADELAVLVDRFLATEGYAGISAVSEIVVGSVVPSATRTLRMMAERRKIPLVEVRGDANLGLTMDVDNPAEVGPDRIANALAALERFAPPLLVVDFGTATTFTYIDASGAFAGGVIAPGVTTALSALASRAARLGGVEVAAPPKAVGRNTVHAMQSGLYYGWGALVDGMVARIEAEKGEELPVIATGGLAVILADVCERIDQVVPTLTLEGLRIARDRIRHAARSAPSVAKGKGAKVKVAARAGKKR
ncbi:MAG TPA: type III pantothenate kinase [bacterium]|nr:type III pantothenate kinase [bacterium]